MRVSLKWRIAASYAVLLIVVMAITSGIIAWRLQTILYDEAVEHVDTTTREIVESTVAQPSPFGSEATSETIAQLLNSNNLATWASPSTFIQIDSTNGYPLARTFNLGGSIIPSNLNVRLPGESAIRRLAIDGRPFLVEDRYLSVGPAAVVLHVAEPLDALNRTFVQTRNAIALVLVAAGIAVVLLSIAIASQAINPIIQLTQAMRETGSDRLDRRLKWRHRNDEIGELAESFNDLLARLSEAFARERQFISDASHELKTPLTSINANAQMLLRWGDRDATIRRESLETIVDESATLAGMVNGMLTLAKADRGDEIPKEPVSLAHLANDALQSAVPRATEKGLEVRFEASDPSPIVYGDSSLLRQLVSNLVDNAIKFTEEGEIDVRIGATGPDAWVEVADSGPGIPDEELAHVFDRFYRADKARSRDVPGTGLGLAIVRSIARVHGGAVSAMRAPSGGALFRATFPRIDESLTALS